jgi:hypothetical protein
MSLPQIYMSRMDVEPAYVDTFVAWCKTRHWPDLVAVGFHSANGYLSVVGGPLSCNVYEIPGMEVFSPDYVQIREVDEELQIIVREKISNHSLTIHDQVATCGVDDGGVDAVDDRRPSLRAGWSCPAMSSVRFDTPAGSDDEVLATHLDATFAALREQPSFVRARLLREADKHPTYPSPEPRWALLVEWADLDAAAASEPLLVGPLTERLADRVDRVKFNAARHVFSLRNEHGWRP